MVDQLMSSHPRRRILICSPRNASIDELVRRLLQLRLKENENRFKRTSVSLLRASYLFYFFLFIHVEELLWCKIKYLSKFKIFIVTTAFVYCSSEDWQRREDSSSCFGKDARVPIHTEK